MIPVARPDLTGNELTYVTECVESSWISSAGKFVTAFEEAFADFCGVRHAISTNNGTTALHLALLGAGVGPGDEVLVPTVTYIASANAVTYCGARPVLVDVDPDTLCLDPEDAERRITPRTRAVMPVHLYGRSADMDAVGGLAARAGLAVVEDAAEAHGATHRGRPVGSLGDVASFSFFGNKIITTGEGGAVTTDDDEAAARMRLLRGQGMDPHRRYWFPVVGFNYRMTNVAAAIGLAQVERVESLLAARRRVAAWYAERLRDVPGVRQLGSYPGTESVDWLVTVVLEDCPAERRDGVMAAMAADSVETRPVFIPLHQLPPYREPDGSYPVAERVAGGGVSLPTSVDMTESDVDRVVASLRAAWRPARLAVSA